jgi:hypothetical protein
MAENGDLRPMEEPPAMDETMSEVPIAADEAEQGRSVWTTVGIVLGALLVLVILISIFFGLMTHPRFTAGLRDVAIIVLALVTMITSILLAILLYQLQSLTVLLRDEIQPILESINQTTSTVRGTTTFVSDTVVSPVIKVAGYVSGVRQASRALFGRSGKQATTSATSREPDLPSNPEQGPGKV